MQADVFRNPPASHRGVTLWMLNDRLETPRLLEQLEGFHAAGWGAVIARTFNGLLTEYLSEEWMEKIGAIVERCEQLGMMIWLQAGYMPSAMPDLPPENQYQGLVVLPPEGDAVEGDLLASDERGRYVLRRMDSVLDLLDGPAVEAYLDKAYRQTWHERFAEHFGKTIEAVWVDEPHFRPQALAWSRGLPQRFEADWGYAIVPHIPSLFFETGDFRKVRHHYWRTAVAMFMEGYFEQVSRWCERSGVKFAGHLMGEDTLNNQIAWTGATMPAYEYMQLPGVDHLTMSLRWPTGKKFIHTPKQMTSVVNQMGIDQALCEIYGVSSHRITFAERKRIADWMAVLGVNTRCMHASFYSLRGRRKRIYAPHLADQQPWWDLNSRMGDYAARQSYALRRGQRRADVLLLHPQESVFCIYDPLAQSDWHNRDQEKPEAVALDTDLVNLCDALLGIQRDFDFGDETLLARHGRLEGNRLEVAQASYPVALLPEMFTIRATTLKLLIGLAEAGGTLLSCAELPARVDGLDAEAMTPEHAAMLEALRRLAVKVDPTPEALRAALNAACAAPFTLADDCPQLWSHFRVDGPRRVLLLVNTAEDRPVRTTLRFAEGGRLEHWGLDDGEVRPAPQQVEGDGVATPLELPPLGSALLVLDTEAPAETLAPQRCETVRTVALGESPRRRRLGPNALTLDMPRWQIAGGELRGPTATVMIQRELEKMDYHGELTLLYDFEIEDLPARLAAAIEVPDSYAITINGQPARYEGAEHFIDRSFLPVDIAAAVRPGANVLELRTDFRPVPKASFALASLYEAHEGTEVEAVYLVGDFAVAAEVAAKAEPERCRLLSRPRLAAEPERGGWNATLDGYGFFAGRLVMSERVTLEALNTDERAVLKLADLHAPAALVRVNGHQAGLLSWNPLELDVTDLLTPGENEVEIEFASSLRNLLGPHHRDSGEPDDCWSTAWNDNRGRTRFEHASERVGWNDNYYCVHFGATTTPVIEIQKKI